MNTTIKQLIVFLMTFYAATSFSIEVNGKVVGVHDGDTVTFLTNENKQIKVRLAEIDAPESAQPYGYKSKQYLSSLVFGKTVTVDVIENDRYGRSVGKIYLGSEYVNAEMVRTGNAWAYKQYLKDKSLLQVEASAKSHKLGLWSLPDSEIMPPWDWRKGGSKNKKQQEENQKADAVKKNSGFSCDGKSKCGEMSSCAEARFYLTQCRVSRLDRDHDGVPCESICR